MTEIAKYKVAFPFIHFTSHKNDGDYDYFHIVYRELKLKIICNKQINYCFVECDRYETKFDSIEQTNLQAKLEELNLRLIFGQQKNKCNKLTPKIVSHDLIEFAFGEILKLSNISKKKSKFKFDDEYNLFRNFDIKVKYQVDLDKLEEIHQIKKSKNSSSITSIPKELLFSQNQIFLMIINEIKKINSNLNFSHYIVPLDNNPYELLFRFKFMDGKLGQQMVMLNQRFGYDYVEIKFCLDNNLYPFYPPKLEYIRPKIDLALVFNLLNLDFLKLENWNPTISLEWLIINMGSNLEKILPKYIDIESEMNSLKLNTISFSDLEYNLIQLAVISKEKPFNTIPFNFDTTKITFTELTKRSESKYWKAGVGFGCNDRTEWDIKSYIKERENSIDEIIKILNNICLKIKHSTSNILFTSVLPTYLINKIRGTTLLDIQKNVSFYNVIFKILSKLTTLEEIPQIFVNEVAINLKHISNDVLMLISNSNIIEDSINNDLYIVIHCTSNWFQERKQIVTENVIVNTNKNKNDIYLELVKKEQFSNYELSNTHRFYKDKYLKEKPNTKSLIRIASEISTFKNSLPIDWDTSILVRVSQNHINLFTFIITGPKDTPYHNGIFEFHAHFPSTYPQSVPQVLLDTTGKGSVRFNPNLYNCGKVCLSLLGTWSGQDGETWNPATSTFLQVLVSIQSLIMVENPYFNEPGWERQMHTEAGKKKSFEYSDKIRLETIRWAINDKIINPPPDYQNFIKEHFKLKQDELIEVTEKWVSESIKYKTNMKKEREKMIKLLNKLANDEEIDDNTPSPTLKSISVIV